MKTLFGLNASQWFSLLRTGGKVVGTVMVTMGCMTSSQENALAANFEIVTGGVVAAVPILCDLYAHTIGAAVARIKAAGGAAAAPGTLTAQNAPATMKAASHWLVTVAGLALLAPLLGGCIATLNGAQVVVTPQNFVQVVIADAVATCNALVPLANKVEIAAPAVADVIGQDAAGASVANVAAKSTAACNKITGQLATGSTAVPPVPAVTSPPSG